MLDRCNTNEPLVSVQLCSGSQTGLARFVQASTTMGMFVVPRNVEPELIGPYAEVVVAGLRLRVPKSSLEDRQTSNSSPYVPGK